MPNTTGQSKEVINSPPFEEKPIKDTQEVAAAVCLNGLACCCLCNMLTNLLLSR